MFGRDTVTVCFQPIRVKLWAASIVAMKPAKQMHNAVRDRSRQNVWGLFVTFPNNQRRVGAAGCANFNVSVYVVIPVKFGMPWQTQMQLKGCFAKQAKKGCFVMVVAHWMVKAVAYGS